MDKLAIVIGNYADRECDADTTPRQAYERGFRRAAEKCDAVMRSRKAENDALKESLAEAEHSESMAWDRTRKAEADNEKLRDLIFDMLVDEERGNTEENTYYEHIRLARELGIDGIEVKA